MTDPVRRAPSTWTRPLDTEAADTLEPSGCFRSGTFAFSVRMVRQAPMAFVTAVKDLFDRTSAAIRIDLPAFLLVKNGEHQYKSLQDGAKAKFFDYAVRPGSWAVSGPLFEDSLVFLESRLKVECGEEADDVTRFLREYGLPTFQNIAIVCGLPVTGGVYGIVYGVSEILKGLSTRKASRVTAFASQTVLRRAELSRRALERLGSDKTLMAAMLLESRNEYEGVAYGKTPHSAVQADLRRDAIARHSPKGQPPGLVPRDRREKYEEYAADATEEAIQRATMLADRILTAIAHNEVNAQEKGLTNETTTLIDIALGTASVAVGVVLIVFPFLPALPILLAVAGIFLLQMLLRHSKDRLEAPDKLLAEEIMSLLENRTASEALGRKFVKAVLRENGMDGAGLQALHFAHVCKDDWMGPCANAPRGFEDRSSRRNLHIHAKSVVALQLRALLTGSSARDAVTHRRIVVREHPSEPPRKRADVP